MSVIIPDRILNCTSDAGGLFLQFLRAKQHFSPEMLESYGNDPVKGVSVCEPVLIRLLKIGKERYGNAIDELRQLGILTGESPHWQLHLDLSRKWRNRRAVIISAKVRRKLLAGFCVHCGSREKLTIDHIVPVAQGGTDRKDNLQALCRSCNAKKRDRFIG